ncbi:MAG: thioredoxin family protein [Verrucomicrobiota bacterium]
MNWIGHPWLLSLSALCLITPGIPAQEFAPPAPWGSELSAAQAAAKESGTDIVVAFTGQEWSAVCRKLAEHFLEQPDFTDRLRTDFELVWLDVSEFRTIDPREKKQELPEKARLRIDYGISSFPALVFMEADGKPYAFTGFPPGGIRSFGQRIERFLEAKDERLENLTRAEGVTGVRRAELLFATLPPLAAERLPRFYGDVMREIIELDPEHETDFSEDVKWKLADYEYVSQMIALDADLRWMDMVELTNQHIEKYELAGSRKQAALMNRFDIQRRQDDLPGMVKTLQEVIAINSYNPHGRQASQLLNQITDQIN